MKKIVCYVKTYAYTTNVHALPALTRGGRKKVRPTYAGGEGEEKWLNVQQALNIAYGFADGACNFVDDTGNIVAKPIDPEKEEALQKAAFSLRRNICIPVMLTIYDDGTCDYELATD
jgi:hypothetical protein